MYFASQKNESKRFYYCLQANLPPKILTSPARQRKLTHFPNKEALFENLFFLPAERGHYDKKLYEKSSAK